MVSAAKEIPLLRLLVGPPRRNSGHDLALCVGNVIHLGEGVQNLLVQFLALLRVGAAGLGDVLVDEGVIRGLLVRRHVLLLLSNCRKVGPPPELELQLADLRGKLVTAEVELKQAQRTIVRFEETTKDEIQEKLKWRDESMMFQDELDQCTEKVSQLERAMTSLETALAYC